MGALTTDQRRALEEMLIPPYGSVDLMCDGDLISLRVIRVGGIVYRVFVFVNGLILGAWMFDGRACREQKYLCRREKSVYTSKDLALYRRLYGAKKVISDPEYRRVIVTICPDFPSARAALSHLSSVCDEIRIATEEEVATGMEKLDVAGA